MELFLQIISILSHQLTNPTILDGKSLSEKIKGEITTEVSQLKSQHGKAPHLAAILIGSNGASETYIASKIKACKDLGIQSTLIRFDADVTQQILIDKIKEVNADTSINGLIVQLPLPKHIEVENVNETILTDKDVDGFHPANTGKLVSGLDCYIPATPYGIIIMLERFNVQTEGKHCVILGRSHIVGQPMSILLSRNANPGNCTVTLCHSRTKNISDYTRNADIVIAALGKPNFVTAEMVKEGAVVIDVGITRVPADTKSGYKIQGDVKYDEVMPKCSFITPVPGGVGPMTIVGLLMNTVKAFKKQNSIE